LLQPVPRPRRRGKRRKGLWVTLFVLLIAAGGAGAYWWYQPVLPVPEWSTIAGKWSAIISTVGGKVSAIGAKLSVQRGPTGGTSRCCQSPNGPRSPASGRRSNPP